MIGDFEDGLPLANVTIAGIKTQPSAMTATLAGQQCDSKEVQLHYSGEVVLLTNLESATGAGAWSGELCIELS